MCMKYEFNNELWYDYDADEGERKIRRANMSSRCFKFQTTNLPAIKLLLSFGIHDSDSRESAALSSQTTTINN
jgi:hypothetical protein